MREKIWPRSCGQQAHRTIAKTERARRQKEEGEDQIDCYLMSMTSRRPVLYTWVLPIYLVAGDGE